MATIVRFAGLERRRRWLLVEAAWNLMRAKAAIRLLPFRRAVASSSEPLGRPGAADVDDLRRAVEAAARHLPWRSVCFDQGLALQRSLRRRGHDARLRYGLSAPGQNGVGGHVWVELDGRIVIGGEEARAHHSLAVFPRA